MTNDLKSLVRHYVEQVWNSGDLTALENLTTTGFTYQLGGQPARDLDGMKQFIVMIHIAFPDWRVEIMDIAAEETTVTIRWQGQVTHQGVFQSIPPTGKRITVSGINMYAIIDGKIATEWEQTDSLGMLLQLGVRPSTLES